MEKELKRAKIRRGAIKRSLTRAAAFIESDDINTANLTQIRQRKEKIDATWKEFDDVQTTIDLISEEDEADNERRTFENKYFDIISRFEEIITTRASGENNTPRDRERADNNQLREVSNTNSYLRLPKIELPTFSGGYEEWYPFYDTFVSLIHNQAYIPNIQKFHYLRSALRGEAAEVTQSLEISSDNYEEAWQLLRQRYDNKRLIIQKHIKALFELPVVIKENYISLRSLLDGVSKHKRALKALGRSTDEWDDLLMHLITSKLDVTTNKEWENSLTGPDIPILQDLMDFIEHRCHTLEIIQGKAQPSTTAFSMNKQRPSRPTSSNLATPSRTKECPVCKQDHFVFACEAFLKMPVADRSKSIRNSKLCLNCLRSTSHKAKDCTSRGCKSCDKRHNTLLHFSSESNARGESSKDVSQEEPAKHTPIVTSAVQDSENSQVWLSTVRLQVLDVEGRPHSCRALLDPGSQSNLITEALVNRLRLPRHSINTPIIGINQMASLARDVVKVSLISNHYSYRREVDCLVLKHITNKLPATSFNKLKMKIPPNLKLADPRFHLPGDIDILISATVFWESLCVGQIKATEDHPVIQKTLFGWTLGGAIRDPEANQMPKSCNLVTNHQLDESLTRLWESERICERNNYTHEEKLCEEHFTRTHRRDPDGRFVVQLPFRDGSIEQLGESRDMALRRFHSLERKLSKNSELRRQYIVFLEDYQRLGHMEKITEHGCPRIGYYLPHHPVLKEDSLTTKLRVVFDASLKTSTGISLNDTLMIGPTIQEDLWNIILRFRIWSYVMSTDAEKMYRQVRVDDSQTHYQRILWRTNPHEEIETFELKTVTYGTASASYLATRALQETAKAEKTNFPLGAASILSDFYVDDLLTGDNNLDKAIKTRDEIIAALSKGGFKLRKWISNSSKLLQGLRSSETSESVLVLNKGEQHKTLGLHWHASLDLLQYDVTRPTSARSVTKRSILANIARIFDPLGLLGPIIVTGKILLQRLWILKLDWDETVPLEIETRWRTYEAQLSLLNTLKIPRRVVASSQTNVIELHGFCDASLDAYGATIYIKSIDHKGHGEVRLLCARSRVAPVKTITLPRMELCAAHMLALLTHKVSQALNIKFDGIYHWTDSMIVLGWIKSDAKRWSIYVSNRVGQIQELTHPSSWRHTNTKENPADLISRGMPPSQLIQSTLWWHGLPWLKHKTKDLENSAVSFNTEELPEARKHVLIAQRVNQEWNIFSKFSSATRLIRVMAYLLRFLQNTKNTKEERNKNHLTASELNQATICLVKIIQGYHFSGELKALHKGESVPRNSKLNGLAPFIDDSGIIRVGGRLSRSRLPYSARHPIVLPSRHKFTTMLIMREHQNLLHAGPQSTLAALRQTYWPIAGRNAVRQVTRSCVRCFRAAPSSRSMIMGDLPLPRVSPSRPFLHCGIDYCGPFMKSPFMKEPFMKVKESRKRNSSLSKSYVAIFICMSSKAIHLELTFDLSTEAFLNALKRFISRRGAPSDVYTDNGTNFVGADRELKNLREISINTMRHDKVVDFSAQKGINWHFIPPHAPHFGGLWEAAVKAMKFHLKRVAGTASLMHDELQTILIQIEAVLNSRPMIPLSSDPNDHTYLSPAHFLIGDTFTAPAEPTLLDVKEGRLSRWQRVEQIKQHFWKKWHSDYLNQMQQRTKWKTNAPSLKPGDLVIMREDNIPPLCWPMARVEAVHPGADGVVRTATVKNTKGTYKRAASKLCPLLLEANNSDEN